MNEKNIFVSYGHGFRDDIVQKLVQDLREFGFNVFFDVDYLKLGDWENAINEHILASKYFLFLNSSRSVSHEGYCLNELCRAGEANLTIIPIVLEDIPLPLSINKYQRMSLLGCINPDESLNVAKYKDFLINLVGVLNGSVQLRYSDAEMRLKQCLRPVISREQNFKHYSTFCGREDAFEAFDKFLKSSKKIFWVNANPGMGKTAFSSMIAWKYPQYVYATHFCKFNNSDRVNPKTIITSIAYQLLNEIEPYKQKVLELINLDTLFEKNATRIFEYLITEPCSNIHLEQPVVIIIDALDECSWRGSNELCLLFQRMREYIPSWMKFVLTSRNEAEIKRVLLPIAYTYTLSEENTQKDLRAFYEMQFPGIDNKKIELLLVKSEGSFLYATEIVKQIKEENLSLDDINFFPIGIYGFFNDCFSRIFGIENEDYLDYNQVKPILEVLCVAPEPTDIHLLEDVLEWDEYTLKNILSRINGFFSLKDKHIEPLHKSLIDWLTADDICQGFYISKKSGYKRLLKYIENIYSQKQYYNNKYVMKYFGKILIELGEFERLTNILDDYELQKSSINYCEFDSGLESYLYSLSTIQSEKRLDLFTQKTFVAIFSENRRLLYNSGMFFTLRKLGLSEALCIADVDWGLEGEIGKVFYYYIVEDYHKAIKKAEVLLKNNEQLQTNNALIAELYNVKGLSERKLVLFDRALESFDKVIEISSDIDEMYFSEESDIEFELSLAYLIRGKIFLSLLRFDDSNRSCKKAIKILARHIEDMLNGDRKTSNKLFLAEDNRVLAYGYIWQGKYDLAEERLSVCEDIYKENGTSIDRYFIRYKYTCLLLKIMKHDGGDHIYELQEILGNEIVSKYDRGQICFLMALDIFINHEMDERLLEEGLEYARNSADIYDSIDAMLEKSECDMLTLLFAEALNKNIDVDIEDNEYINNWTEYMKSMVKRVKNNNGSENI